MTIKAASSVTPARYLAIRETTQRLAAPLSAEDQGVQSMPEASPTKWHLAHTTWFFETFVLAKYERSFAPFDEQYSFLFNSYYNAIGERVARDQRGMLTRPTLEEIHAYRAAIDERVARLLDGDVSPQALALIELGINHEQQHQELILTDIKHALSLNPLRPAYAKPRADGVGAAALKFSRFAEGVYEIGHAGHGFAYDNEGPRHKVYVQPFEIATRLVTNGEYLEFVKDRGYSRPELWLSDGWDCVRANQWQAPLYWDGGMHFTLAGTQPINPAAPVCHISYYEADAFARWAGYRLPREAEWELAACAQEISGNFLEQGLFAPRVATDAQFFGDVWEWTQSPYVAYPGYAAPPGAIGEYNGKFMVNQIVLRGGSCFTPRSHIRASYRNFFHAHARWQMMGLRLCKDA